MSRTRQTTMTGGRRLDRISRYAGMLGLELTRPGSQLRIEAGGRLYMFQLAGRTTVRVNAWVKDGEEWTHDSTIVISDDKALNALERIVDSLPEERDPDFIPCMACSGDQRDCQGRCCI